MEAERIFPFIGGDRIRLKTWAEGVWVRVVGYGQVYFIGEDQDGTEAPFHKDAGMAYGSEWEIYAPAPAPFEAFLYQRFDVRNEDDGPKEQWIENIPNQRHMDHMTHVWRVTITPVERINP